MSIRLLKIILHGLAVFWFTGVMLYMASYKHEAYVALVGEDNPIELAQYIFYLLCSVLCRYIAVEFFRQQQRLPCTLFFLATAAFFIVAMEEISWGQRIFQLKTPTALMSINVQRELNLHNIGDAVLVLRRVFVIGAIYAIASGIAFEAWAEWCQRKRRPLGMPVYVQTMVGVPQFGFYFIPTILFNTLCKMYSCLPVINFGIDTWRFQEVSEFGFSLGCMLILRHHLIRLQTPAGASI